MKLLLAALLTVACIAPAMAEEVTYTPEDETALQQCIEAVNDTNSAEDAGDSAKMSDCIGTASNLCQEEPGGSSTIGMVECNQREQAWWDMYLNSNYAELETSLDPIVFDTLKLAQRAWLKYRDAKCTFVDALWRDGSIQPVMHSSCTMETTATRAIELADALGGP